MDWMDVLKCCVLIIVGGLTVACIIEATKD